MHSSVVYYSSYCSSILLFAFSQRLGGEKDYRDPEFAFLNVTSGHHRTNILMQSLDFGLSL
jgi:hypothetical protein